MSGTVWVASATAMRAPISSRPPAVTRVSASASATSSAASAASSTGISSIRSIAELGAAEEEHEHEHEEGDRERRAPGRRRDDCKRYGEQGGEEDPHGTQITTWSRTRPRSSRNV